MFMPIVFIAKTEVSVSGTEVLNEMTEVRIQNANVKTTKSEV